MSTDASVGLKTMLDLVRSMPEHLAASNSLEGLQRVKPLQPEPRRLVLCAMGGSAIAGDLMQPLLEAGTLSLDIWRNYGLPHWVGPDDLVIAASYSGNTEECLSAVAEARQRGARLLFITSGGQLSELAGNDESVIKMPGGLPPRAALGHSFGALLQTMERLGCITNLPESLDEAVSLMQDRADEVEQQARKLAQKLHHRLPVMYATDSLTSAVATRWKGQLNENSKIPALMAAFPELNHNDIVGWGLSETWQDRLVLVILRSGYESERLQRRTELTAQLLDSEFAEVLFVEASGRSPLARIMSLVQLGDQLSCQLAALRQVNPVPVDRIDQLKKGLSEEDKSC